MRRLFGAFSRNDRGNVAVVFAAVLVPVIGIVAAAFDYGRASMMRNQIQSASEAAAVAVSHQLHLDREHLAKIVRTHLDANLEGDLKALPFEITIPADKSSVEIAMQTSVPTSLLGIVGIPEIEIATTAHAMRAEPKLPEMPLPSTPPGGGAPDMGVRELMRSVSGGGTAGAPDPEAIRAAQEQVARALREAMPAMPNPGAIHSSEDLRRAADQINQQVRELQRQIGAGGAPEIEQMMRQLRR